MNLSFDQVAPSQAIGLVALSLGTWLFSLVIFRVYFHKLAAFPGPWLAAVTHLYEWYYDIWLGGQYTWKLKELHEYYGPVLRINPDELHFNDPDYYDQIFNNSNGVTEKPYRAANAFGPYPAAIGTVQHDLHRIRRGAINPFFSRRSVSQIIPFSKRIIDNLCRRFGEAASSGELVNIKYAYAALTLDIITEYCFSECSDRVLKLDFDKRALDDIDGLVEFSLLNVHLPWLFTPLYNLPDWILSKINPAMAGILEWRESLSSQVEDIRLGRNERFKTSGHETIFHSLLQSNLPAIELSRARLRDEAFSLVSAGSGTTFVKFEQDFYFAGADLYRAYTLKSTTFFIMNNPNIHRKLLDELKIALPNRSDEPDLGKLERLPYLTAVILEGLRLSNAVTHRLMRSFPERTLVYKNLSVPPNTTVMMTSLLMHHNEKIFPEPKAFKPERWLDGDQQKLQRYLIPFSRGTRACAGINLAWAELYIILGTVFRRFEFDISNVIQKRDIDIHRDTILAATAPESPGVLVKVKAMP